jgi:superfamily I DNA/RNA helicase
LLGCSDWFAATAQRCRVPATAFRAVDVLACDDEVIPSQQRIEDVVEDSDLDEVYETEWHLLYVACTRARDQLLVSSGNRPSEFLDDLRG